jgi:trimeric autotransporter adhesin
MAFQITSEGGANLSPSAPFQLDAEGGANLSPAVHGNIASEGGASLSPTAPEQLVSEGGRSLAVAATATVNVSVGLTSGQTVTIGGVPYTALVPDNGAAARIFDDAQGLADVINGLRTDVAADANVTATVVGTLVTLQAIIPGVAGNSITLAKTGAAITLSESTLIGGVEVATPHVLTSEGGANLSPSAPEQLVPESSY